MHGHDERSGGLFSYVSCEARVPLSHPLRPIRAIVDEALEVLSSTFEGMYSKIGRPSIPPEKLLRALLLQAFYSVRSERQLMEQLDYNLLFRWFVELSMDAPVWDVTVASLGRRPTHRGTGPPQVLKAQGVKGCSRQADPSGQSTGTTRPAYRRFEGYRGAFYMKNSATV